MILGCVRAISRFVLRASFLPLVESNGRRGFLWRGMSDWTAEKLFFEAQKKGKSYRVLIDKGLCMTDLRLSRCYSRSVICASHISH